MLRSLVRRAVAGGSQRRTMLGGMGNCAASPTTTSTTTPLLPHTCPAVTARRWLASSTAPQKASSAPPKAAPAPAGGGGGGKSGKSKPKKKKGKRPSVTAAYLTSRAEQLAKHEMAAKQANLPWRIVAASIVERHPIIIRDPEPWEADYFEMKEELMKHAKVFPKELNLMGDAADLDRPDEEVLPELPFKLAPRVTKADRLNDRTTLNRALAERLFLLVKGPATNGKWDVPAGVFSKGSMRKVHEGNVGRFLGEKFEAYVPSNAPVGMHWRVNDAAAAKDQGVYGDKVFFYRAQHMKGRGRVVEPGVEEFVWVTREEISEYLPQGTPAEKEYAELLTNIL